MSNDPVHTPEDSKKESTLDTKELTKLKGQLRAQAERTVVQNHQEEYHAEAERLFAEHGLEFTRRLTAEEKAKKDLDAILKAHPGLASQVQAVQGHPTAKGQEPAAEESAEQHDDGPAALSDQYRPF